MLSIEEIFEVVNEKGTILENKDEKIDRYKHWITFYRRNIDLFAEDVLGIKLKPFQKIMLLEMADGDITDIVTSRGLSKTFITALFSIIMSLLYSNQEVLVVSFTLSQSNGLIEDKIIKELADPKNGLSPVLRQLVIDGWMQFKKDQNTNARYVEFGNGSKIYAAVCGESTRGSRSTITITDECVLVKKTDYDSIIEPTLRPRQFAGRPIDYDEETKQLFLSSAKAKTNWYYRHLKNCVVEHYRNKKIKYNFYCGDIFVAVCNGIQTKNQYLQRKKDSDPFSFQSEYLNVWLGSSEDSLYQLEDFENNQRLEKAFIPRNKFDYLENKKIDYKFSSDWIRFLSCDIALATGQDDDNSVFILGCINKNTGERRIEYIIPKHGLNTLMQVVFMKRLFYEYQSTYCIMDVKGVGQGVFDLLTVTTNDTEYGTIYPAWTVCRDNMLQISSDSVMNDKIKRTIEIETASEIIIPYAGNAELNSQGHLALRKALRDGYISLLKDDAEIKAVLEDKDPKFVTKTAEQKAEILMPYLQTRLMINEAISLNTKITEMGYVKLSEAVRTDTKDRYMTLMMANLLADKIQLKYQKDTEPDWTDDDWAWLAG